MLIKVIGFAALTISHLKQLYRFVLCAKPLGIINQLLGHRIYKMQNTNFLTRVIETLILIQQYALILLLDYYHSFLEWFPLRHQCPPVEFPWV